jgi:hypothetical protein
MRSTVTMAAIRDARDEMDAADTIREAIDRVRQMIGVRGDATVKGLDIEWSDIDAALEVLQDECITAYHIAEDKLLDLGVTP